MKKQVKKIFFCFMISLLLYSSSIVNADTLTMDKSELTRGKAKGDSHQDDPVQGKLDKDDFESVEDWEEYLKRHPEEQKNFRYKVIPNHCVGVDAKLKYTVTGLPIGTAIQRCYVEDDYIYVTQRKNSNIYLSRCLLDSESTIATYQDGMLLKEFAHGQTLESFVHNGKTYFWISCKTNTAYENLWAMQVGRIQYVPGETIEDYTAICRFSDLNYANKEGIQAGSVKRVDAALSTDETKLLLWVQNTKNAIQYSYYDTRVLNNLLDEKEGTIDNFVSFQDNDILKTACYGSFQQTAADDRILPNNSFQGLEFSNTNSIYIVGGKTGEQPRMSVMKGAGSEYYYESLVTFSNESFGSKTEIEGIQLSGDEIYFGICDHNQKKEQQFVYAVNKEKVDTAQTEHIWDEGKITLEPTCEEEGTKLYTCKGCQCVKPEAIPAVGHKEDLRNQKDAGCEENGYTGDFYCKDCGKLMKEGQVIKPFGHQWDAGNIILKPTAINPGTRIYTCKVCKTTKEESIKAKGAPRTGTKLRYGTTIYKVTKAGLKNGTVELVKTASKLQGIRIPDTVEIEGILYKVTSIGNKAFQNSKTLKKLIIGNNVTKIGSYAFSGCKKLMALSLGKTVVTIGDKAFYKCSALKEITIPASVNKIGTQTFYGCSKLKTIQIKTTKLSAKKIGSKAFKGIYKKAIIRVPKKKYSAYKKLLKQKGISSKIKIKNK